MNSNFHAGAFDATRLKQIRFVVKVAELGSLAAAAEALHMTPSAASMLLRSVEQALGGRLFERTALGMAPTARARGLMPRLRTLLGEADALAVAAGARDPRPAVRIGLVPHMAATVLPRVVAALAAGAAPRRVQLHEGRAAVLAEMLSAAQLDFLLGKIPSDFAAAKLARLACCPMYQDGLAVVARRGHALARRRRSADLDELQAAQWLLPPAGSTTHTAFINAWLAAGRVPPEPGVECPSYLYGLGIVEASDMLSCCAASAAAASRLAIVAIDTPLRLHPVPVGLFWRAGSSVAEEVAPLLRAVLAEAPGRVGSTP